MSPKYTTPGADPPPPGIALAHIAGVPSGGVTLLPVVAVNTGTGFFPLIASVNKKCIMQTSNNGVIIAGIRQIFARPVIERNYYS
jgi:hypothetical protein